MDETQLDVRYQDECHNVRRNKRWILNYYHYYKSLVNKTAGTGSKRAAISADKADLGGKIF